MEVTRHFTTSVYIVFKNKVLLHKHKKYDLILPPGGHIDRDELPHEAALREVKEETGVPIKLYNARKELKFEKTHEPNIGVHFNLHNINQFHQHADFIFYAWGLDEKVNPAEGESKDMKWYTREEIEKNNSIHDEARYYALEALDLLGDK